MMGDDFLAMTIIFVCGEGWMWVVKDGFLSSEGELVEVDGLNVNVDGLF